MDDLAFTPSIPLTLGTELELQLLDPETLDLKPAAEALLGHLQGRPHADLVKPEITRSMIEIATSVHEDCHSLGSELASIRDGLGTAAARAGVLVGGGGTHPFQDWRERQVYPAERFEALSDTYGYLARQFTVFGQHIHIGCPDGDTAMYLCHALLRYAPHFIAMAASSPFCQGVDTAFDSARSNVVRAFPLAGHAPIWIGGWDAFREFFERMQRDGIAGSIKDLYWDIRPKPGFGTVEIRVLDTPLTVGEATEYVAYAQTLAAWLIQEQPVRPTAELAFAYAHNRFQAARFGLRGSLIDSDAAARPVGEDILRTLHLLHPFAMSLGTVEFLDSIAHRVARRLNGARALRESYAQGGSFHSLVRKQAMAWAMH